MFKQMLYVNKSVKKNGQVRSSKFNLWSKDTKFNQKVMKMSTSF